MSDQYQDIPRIYTAIAECLACFICCSVLPRKISNKKFAVLSVLFLVIQSVLLVSTQDIAIYMWIPIMMLAVILMCAYIMMVCNISTNMNIYSGLKAFVASEFAAALEWQLACYFNMLGNMNMLTHLLLLVLVYGAFFSIIYTIEKKQKSQDFVYEISRKELVSVLLIVMAIFGFSNMNFLIQNTPFSGGGIYDVFIVRTLINLGGLAILYAYQSRVFELQAEKELLAINTVFQSQYDNYRNYAESIDLINVKYHDLKHQVAGLRGEMSAEKRMEWLDTIEAELEVYRPEQQTGNYILDTIIAGKLNSCSKRKIKFTCVADGKLIGFMHVIDICNIFGNALDNAIENISLVEDEEKRIIHMKVFSKGDFLFISVMNYCDHRIEMKNGFPVTTKVNKANHGYGIKSIDFAVKKYRGNMTYGVNNDMFEIRILIPMQEE